MSQCETFTDGTHGYRCQRSTDHPGGHTFIPEYYQSLEVYKRSWERLYAEAQSREGMEVAIGEAVAERMKTILKEEQSK